MFQRVLSLIFLSVAAPALAANQLPEITTMGEYSTAENVGEDREYRLRAEFDVLYYDADWQMLWVRWNGVGGYIGAPSRPLPIEVGQRIRLEGFARPGTDGVLWSRTSIEVLEEWAFGDPVAVEGEIENIASLDAEWGEIGGLVRNQMEMDDSHLRLEVASGERLIETFVHIDRSEPIPQFTGTFVRIRGAFFAKREPRAADLRFELLVSGLDRIETVSPLRDDPRFETPSAKIEALPERTSGELVRIDGIVHDRQPGVSVTIRDGTGQVKLMTRQDTPVDRGDPIEAVGYPDTEGIEYLLRRGYYRRRDAGEGESGTGAGDALPKLRLTEQVRLLELDEADRGYPVQLAGVVTWSHPEERAYFIQDASGGIRVVFPEDAAASRPEPGNRVVVTGVTRMGDFVAEVEGDEIDHNDSRALPEPKTLTFEQAMTGAEYGEWIELRGYVRSVAEEGSLRRLAITSAGGEFTALVAADESLDELAGAVVRLRGVCDVSVGPRRRLRGIRVKVPSADLVEVEEAKPEDVFATPARSIESLHQFSGVSGFNRRVRVSGRVVLHRPGEFFYVQEDDDSLLALSRQTENLQPGDRVDVVGFPGREGGRLLLREAVYRRTGSGAEPEPITLPDIGTPQADFDGRLVRIEGTLLDMARTGRDVRLHLQGNGSIFEANLAKGEDSGGDVSIRPGSVLELTGVYRVELDEYHEPRAFAIDLRSPADIRIVRSGTWWTPARVGAASTALTLIALVAGSWALTLRRGNRLLQRAQLDLKKANDELEDRVAQRTGTLNRAREELAREHARLKFIIDSVPMGISLTHFKPDGSMVNWTNPVHWRIAGLQQDAAETDAFRELTHPDDRPVQDELHRRLESGDVKQYSIEKRYVRPDEEIVWVQFSVQRRKLDDGGFEDLSTVVDVTALKRSQEEAAYERDLLRTLMDHSLDYIYFKDLQSRFIKASHSHARCFGLESPEEMVGKTDFDFFKGNHAERAFREEQEIIQTGKPVIGKVERESYKFQDGELWVTTSKMPYRNREGEIVGIFGISRDITELKRAEAELESTHRRLIEASRQAGMAEVATSVLHNVGNVLNSVNVSATIVEQHLRRSKVPGVARLAALVNQHADDLGRFLTETPQGRHVPGYLRTLGEHLTSEQAEMLEELKSLRSRVEHIKEIVSMQQNYAKMGGAEEVVAVTELVEDALNINVAAYARHGVSVERDFRAHPKVTAERHKVLQILVNLLRNAIDACRDADVEEKRITIRVADEGERIQIVISDNGIGIPPENLSRIFGHGFTTRKDGHGFGLHSAALAAEEMNGTLRAHSDGPGTGASFTLEL